MRRGIFFLFSVFLTWWLPVAASGTAAPSTTVGRRHPHHFIQRRWRGMMLVVVLLLFSSSSSFHPLGKLIRVDDSVRLPFFPLLNAMVFGTSFVDDQLHGLPRSASLGMASQHYRGQTPTNDRSNRSIRSIAKRFFCMDVYSFVDHFLVENI
jgi:hypothetical protein